MDENNKNDEQLNNLLRGVDEFAEAMKKRLVEQHRRGVSDWQDHSLEHCSYKIRTVGDEVKLNPRKDVDAANWCLIHYLNRQL